MSISTTYYRPQETATCRPPLRPDQGVSQHDNRHSETQQSQIRRMPSLARNNVLTKTVRMADVIAGNFGF